MQALGRLENGLLETQWVSRVAPEELFGARLPPPPGPGGRGLRALADFMRRARPRSRVLLPHVRFEAQGYVRETLFRSPEWELVLCCWGPGHRSRIHDHGGSSGVARVLYGETLEERFRPVRAGQVVRGASLQLAEGGVLVEAAASVHRLRNASQEPALTLHLYAPPLAGMRHYEPAGH